MLHSARRVVTYSRRSSFGRTLNSRSSSSAVKSRGQVGLSTCGFFGGTVFEELACEGCRTTGGGVDSGACGLADGALVSGACGTVSALAFPLPLLRPRGIVNVLFVVYV